MTSFTWLIRSRVLLTAVSALSLGVAPLGAQTSEATGDPVRIDSGLLSGKKLASGVKAYFGIPYAAAPIGDLRWRETQPVKPWSGVLNADHFGADCPQGRGGASQSEDCLFINVWAPPTAKAGDKLPVVVYIFGGAFTGGSSARPRYGSEAFARKGAVFVNFNYRLGVLGRLAHPELTAESAHKASGNYSRLDQIAALQWVKRNIDKFGGDPRNVTLSGQSSGAMDVTALYASPLAKGLFNHVVAMSGSAMGGPAGPGVSLQQAEQNGVKFQELLGATSLADMRKQSADAITNVKGAPATEGGPAADGYVLPESAADIFKHGKQNDVPAILGNTSEETFPGSPRPPTTVEQYKANLKTAFGDEADQVFKMFPASSDADATLASKKAWNAAQVGSDMLQVARVQTATGKSPVYLFVFARGATVPHGADVPYWLGVLDVADAGTGGSVQNVQDYDRQLSDQMQNAVLALAKSNNPSLPNFAWPRYNPKNQQVMELGDRAIPVAVSEGVEFFAARPQLKVAARGAGGPPQR